MVSTLPCFVSSPMVFCGNLCSAQACDFGGLLEFFILSDLSRKKGLFSVGLVLRWEIFSLYPLEMYFSKNFMFVASTDDEVS